MQESSDSALNEQPEKLVESIDNICRSQHW